MGCRDDAMSNVLVDTGSSLNVLPKSTLSKLSYQGPPMRQSGVVVKAFDGSRKTVIGEVDLPIKIGPSDFQITFQKRAPSFASYKDAKMAIERGATTGLGKMIELKDNKSRAGIGFSSGTFNKQCLFKSGGFIHTGLDEEAAAVLEEDTKDSDNFIIPGGVYNNWVAVDIPTVVHKSTLISKPIEHNDPTPSPNFEFPVFEAEEDDVEEISDEITRLLDVALREKPAGKQKQQSRHRALFIPKEGKETLEVNLEKTWSRDQREMGSGVGYTKGRY
ncbi:hypothetical protein KIW84_012838 [Lathyrus oleraceus]|uniref:Peptidase A2 domain-containing protein n=1 Tax=Pisum sativum TaxID=3888 RepID=A0A9D5BIQ8_PEA|nr:hypothetical protein KIW84_012838 [Pisum sativum]